MQEEEEENNNASNLSLISSESSHGVDAGEREGTTGVHLAPPADGADDATADEAEQATAPTREDKLDRVIDRLDKVEAEQAKVKAELAKVKSAISGIRKSFFPATVFALMETAVFHVMATWNTEFRAKNPNGSGTVRASEHQLNGYRRVAVQWANYALCKLLGNTDAGAAPTHRQMPTDEKPLYFQAMAGLYVFLESLLLFDTATQNAILGKWPAKPNVVAHNGKFLECFCIPDSASSHEFETVPDEEKVLDVKAFITSWKKPKPKKNKKKRGQEKTEEEKATGPFVLKGTDKNIFELCLNCLTGKLKVKIEADKVNELKKEFDFSNKLRRRDGPGTDKLMTDVVSEHAVD